MLTILPCKYYFSLLVMMPVGFGFLTFDNEEAVELAVKEHFVDFNGKKVKINRLVSVSWLDNHQAMAPLGLVKKMAFLLFICYKFPLRETTTQRTPL